MENRTRSMALVCAAAAVAAYLSIDPARAGTKTANLAVSATVANNCTITTTALNFGTYDPVVDHASTPLDGTGEVSIACTKGAVTPISLDLGANASGSTRRMKDAGGDYLTYELYYDSAGGTVWGDGGSGNGAKYTPAAAPSKAERPFTVYGRVAAGQDVPTGSYGDTVHATVEF